MKAYLIAALAATVATAATAADSLDNIGTVRLKGPIGNRLEKMIKGHVIAQDIDYITAPFMEKTERHGWWHTEFWGKFMHSAVPYAFYTGSEDLGRKVDVGIDRILSTQEPCGYIGNYPDELRCGDGWDVWGMKYTMMGLLHYYDGQVAKKDEAGAKKTLAACRRLCDYVIGEIGPDGKRGRELWETGYWSGYASSSILEPVVWLTRRVAATEGVAAAEKYFGFATFVVKGMTEPEAGPRLVDLALKGVSVADRNGYGNKANADGGYVQKRNRWKAYEMMSCYQGMLEYYQYATEVRKGGAPEGIRLEDLKKAAIMTGEDIVKEEINLAGGCACSEAWYHGAKKQHLAFMKLQETCVTTTWMRFCEKLLEMTGDPKWADQIERSFYNIYLAALKPDGSEFAPYTPLSGSRCHGMIHCYMHTDCCTANGPRGFLCFLKELFRTDGKTATFNFYSSSIVTGFDVFTLYPRKDYVRITSHTTGPLDLRLRIPGWSEKTSVSVNGSAAMPGVKAGSYFTLSRNWALGDIVEIRFDMPVVAHRLDHHFAFTRGPILLARDSRFADGDMTAPIEWRALADGQRMKGFAAVASPSDDMWMAFSGTLPLGGQSHNQEAAHPRTVFFCDYASAGNSWRRDDHYRTWFPEEYYATE